MKLKIWMAAAFFLIVCARAGISEETDSSTIRKINPKNYGVSCEIDDECGDLVAVNCLMEKEGPYYYVNVLTGETAGYCGELCDNGGCDLSECPPPEWTCANN